MSKRLLKGGRVVDPANGRDGVFDVLVDGDRIARVARAKPDVIIMHPGPMNRGVEIASDVADGPYSVILEQGANGVAVRMAVLYLLAGELEAA